MFVSSGSAPPRSVAQGPDEGCGCERVRLGKRPAQIRSAGRGRLRKRAGRSSGFGLADPTLAVYWLKVKLALESVVTVTLPNRSLRVAVPVLSTQLPMTL
jgi:hypothetical protein